MLCCSVVQSCLTLLWPHGLYPLGSSVYGIFQARILLECIAISFSRGSSWPRYQTWVSCTMGKLFTAEPLGTWRALISLLCSKLSYYSPLIFSRLVFLKNYFLSFLFLEIRSYDGWLEFILLDRERGKKGLHQFFVLFCFYSTSLPSSRAKAPCQDKPKIFACLSPRSIVWRVKSSK